MYRVYESVMSPWVIRRWNAPWTTAKTAARHDTDIRM